LLLRLREHAAPGVSNLENLPRLELHPLHFAAVCGLASRRNNAGCKGGQSFDFHEFPLITRRAKHNL
jgi:hypothetical protein